MAHWQANRFRAPVKIKSELRQMLIDAAINTRALQVEEEKRATSTTESLADNPINATEAGIRPQQSRL